MSANRLVVPFLFLVAIPATAPAQTKPPTVALRVNSIDSLIEHVKFLASLAGEKDAARQIDDLIKSKIGPKGLEGVDAKRPFGLYARVGKDLDDISGAVLVPIADENAFLNLLKNLGFPATKGDKGIYTVNTGTPINAFMRFTKNYAYVTALNVAALDDKNLLDPAVILAGSPANAFTLTVQLDQIPETAKLITSSQAEQVLQDIQDKKIPGETPAQKALRGAALKEATKFIVSVLKNGKELVAKVDLDQKSGDLSATFSLSGVAGSELATGIAGLAKDTSAFAGMRQKGEALASVGHVKLPEALLKPLSDVVDEAPPQILATIQDATKKLHAEAFLKAIAPTLKSGDFDGALVGTSDGKHLTLVTGFKVKNGKELDTTVRNAGRDVSKDPKFKGRVLIDFDSAGAVKIHKIEFPKDEPGAKEALQVLGELSAYVAVRDDAMFISWGKGGLVAIKNAIPIKGTVPGPMLFFEIDVAKWLKVTPVPPDVAAKSRALFPSDGGTIRMSVEGGSALTFRFNTKVAVLQLVPVAGNIK